MKHLVRNYNHFQVWCGHGFKGYEDFMGHRTDDINSCDCYACLEVVVIAGEDAVQRIIRLDGVYSQ